MEPVEAGMEGVEWTTGGELEWDYQGELVSVGCHLSPRNVSSVATGWILPLCPLEHLLSSKPKPGWAHPEMPFGQAAEEPASSAPGL